MSTDHVSALILIFVVSYAIATNWRKVVVILCALAITAVCFGVYSIVEVVRSDLGPVGVHGSPPEATAQSTVPRSG